MNAACRKFAWLMLAWLCSAEAQAQTAKVLVIETTLADQPAAERFLALTERPTELWVAPEARATEVALARARAEDLRDVVIFDRERSLVTVLRARDGARWTRATDQVENAPFAAAFIAVELLALSAHEEPSEAFRLRWLGIRLGAHALLGTPYRGSPSAEMGLIAAFGLQPWSLLLELSSAFVAHHQQALGAGRLQLARSDVGLRAGALYQPQRLGMASFLGVGAAITRAQYHGQEQRTERRVSASFTLALEPQLILLPWLRLYLSAAIQATTPAADYRSGASDVLRVPRLGGQLGGGLWGTLPFDR